MMGTSEELGVTQHVLLALFEHIEQVRGTQNLKVLFACVCVCTCVCVCVCVCVRVISSMWIPNVA